MAQETSRSSTFSGIWMRSNRRTLWIVSLLVAIGGCGGGDSSDTADTATAARPSPPVATQELSAQLLVFERAASKPNCDDALEVMHPVVLSNPSQPASKSNCGDALYPMRSEKGVRVVGSEELGTGAVVSTVLGQREEDLIWALDQTGRYKWTGSFIGTPPPGNQLASEAQFQDVADAFVKALRDEDCHAAFASLSPSSRLAQDGEQAFCQSFEATFTGGPEGLASRLQRDPGARPVLLDRTEDLAVFALATAPAGYRTLFVGAARLGAAPVVIDAIPVEQ